MADQPETSMTEDLAEAMKEHDTEEIVETNHEEQEAAAPEAAEETVQAERESEPEPAAEQQAEPDKTPEDHAPVDWSATVKDEWPNLPAGVREAITKRERDVNVTLQQTTESRRIADQFVRTVEPFRALMAAEGIQDPFQAVQGLMQTTARLKMGSVQEKANGIAQLVKHYGVDITALDAALVGEQVPEQQGQMQDPRVDQLMAQLNQNQQHQDQQVAHQATQTVEAFVIDPKNEFAQGLRHQMADEIDMAAMAGQNISMNEAYERAAWKNTEVRGIMLKRHDDEKLGTGNMMGKKNAASSISGKRGATNSKDTDSMSMREMIASQFGDDSRI
jgi:hypothetical protein